jgi:hypothetical protein
LWDSQSCFWHARVQYQVDSQRLHFFRLIISESGRLYALHVFLLGGNLSAILVVIVRVCWPGFENGAKVV